MFGQPNAATYPMLAALAAAAAQTAPPAHHAHHHAPPPPPSRVAAAKASSLSAADAAHQSPPMKVSGERRQQPSASPRAARRRFSLGASRSPESVAGLAARCRRHLKRAPIAKKKVATARRLARVNSAMRVAARARRHAMAGLQPLACCVATVKGADEAGGRQFSALNRPADR